MNISIQETSDITTLKRLWAELYDSNPQLTTFDSYEFCKAIHDDMIYRFMTSTHPRYFVVRINGKSVIFPLSFNRRNKQYQFINRCNGGEYCSPIFDYRLSANELHQATAFLVHSISHPIIFADILDTSNDVLGGVIVLSFNRLC